MNLEQIKSLVSVVNNKSFSQAAKAMYVSQPTISMHIKTLENELGEQLLIRSTKDVVLSEAGKTFYPYAVRMLKAEEEALYQMKHKEKEVTGEVLVASSSVSAHYLIPGFLAYAKKKQPGIHYRVAEGDSAEVIQKIMRFEDEIGIGSICPANMKCTATPLLEDKIVLITPNTKKYRALKGVMDCEILKKEEFVVRENGSGTRASGDSLEKMLGLHVDQIKVAAEVHSTESVKRAVSEGVGIAFISGLAVRDYVEQKRLLMFDFSEALTRRELYLLKHVERNLSRTSECAVELLKEYCEGLAK